MKKIAAERNYRMIKEADIEPSAEVLAAALKAIGGTIPRLSYQVTEGDVRIILSELYRAGYSLVRTQ